MKVLVVDMTHGGGLIALEFLKSPEFDVYAYDLYKTLNHENKALLIRKGIKFVDNLNDLNALKNKDDFLVVAPVHCPVSFDSSNSLSKNQITHHEAVGFLMKDRIPVPVVEVTGVKGKTSVVHMLKEILKDLNPLILSSLGVEVIENGKKHLIKGNISITPASIIEAWELARDYENIGICIFETSLGGTGLADVGILTNIAEDYPIARGMKKASFAKTQIFKSKMVACDLESLNSIYPNLPEDMEFLEKVNIFEVKAFKRVKGDKKVKIDLNTNVRALNINFGLYKTVFDVVVENLKTIRGNMLNISFEVSTFAPAYHHLNNVLAAICASLMLEISIEQIKKGLRDFRFIDGRTSIREYKGSKIIEEINPGIDLVAIKKAVRMVKEMVQDLRSDNKLGVIFGGKYGVTCEEIDEEAVAAFFNTLDENISLTLTDELGANIKDMIKGKVEYHKDFNVAVEDAINNGCKIIILIYRSNFADINKR